jgi:heat shock protein HslJ
LGHINEQKNKGLREYFDFSIFNHIFATITIVNMKHLARILSLLILVSAGLFIASCGGSDPSDTSEEETQLNKFKGQWNMSEVKLGGVTQAGYTEAKVTFSGTFTAGSNYSYISTATSWPDVSAWKEDAAWKFKSTNVLGVITRIDDSQDISYSFSTDGNTLTLSINAYAGESYSNTGRVNSVAGNWIFVLTK